MTASDLTSEIRSLAQTHGFSRVGICPAVSPTGLSEFYRWLEDGFAGEMRYLEERAEAYAHPSSVLEGVRSIVALTVDYRTVDGLDSEPGTGRVSRYAWGSVDYHDLIHSRLKTIRSELQRQYSDIRFRGVVDTAPLLERDYARLAGLGWQGKNTMLISRDAGSYFFLAFLLTTAELEYDEPHEKDFCGSCQACLDACPTDAFEKPYVLNARRCISYLTIELRSPMPTGLRNGVGDWLFGCDVCQEVCPWNRFSQTTDVNEFFPSETHGLLDLVQLLEMDDEQFRIQFKKTPLWRSKRRGILRNAAIILGNTRPDHARSALIRALDDSEPLIRGAVVWALRQYEFKESTTQALRRRKEIESDPSVLEEFKGFE